MKMWAILLAAGVLACGARAQDEKKTEQATLKAGDPAPALQPGRWIKGEAVTGFTSGKVYVVEFWATWCGPCRMTIPHLTELQKKFKDQGVTVIGQNVFEDDAPAVEDFVKEMGDKMDYRVALDRKAKEDDEQGIMARTWMEASGQSGIPTAFVVDGSGKIAWLGHPMDGLDQVVTAVLAGNFDPAAMARAQEERMALFMKVATAMQNEEWAAALTAIDEAAKAVPEMAAEMDMARFQVHLMKKDYPAVQKLAGEIADREKENAALLNELAWTLVATEGFDKPDLKLAERIARQANDAAKGEDPAVLDTLARVVFMGGDHPQAVELQAKAVKTIDDEDARAMLQATLDSYKEGKLPPAEPAYGAEPDMEEETDPAPVGTI